jgi:kynurenine formamidase
VDFLPGGYPITGDDLEAACALGGITMAPGDIACVRTGHQYHLTSGNKVLYTTEHPGLSTKSIQWARDTDIAAIATDTMAFECWPCEDPSVLLPVHMIHLRDMGLIQGQNWVLDELAADCASDGQYDFLLSASPLPLTRSVGGPIAPTAIK